MCNKTKCFHLYLYESNLSYYEKITSENFPTARRPAAHEWSTCAGDHRYTLYSLRDKGLIEQVTRGIYRLAGLPSIGNLDLVAVVPRDKEWDCIQETWWLGVCNAVWLPSHSPNSKWWKWSLRFELQHLSDTIPVQDGNGASDRRGWWVLGGFYRYLFL